LNSAAAAFAVSDEGTLIYRHGGAQTLGTRHWIWVDRTGKTSAPFGSPHNSFSPRLSPDGRRLAFFDATGAFAYNVWIYDFDRDVKTRLTTNPNDFHTIWSPDGSQVVFASFRGATGISSALYEKPANAAVPERLLYQSEPGTAVLPRDWSVDGRWIVFEKVMATDFGQRDIWMLALSDDRKPVPYLMTPFDEEAPALSPNGRWLAYASNESGQRQVIVQSFPDPSRGRWQVSTNGGSFPRWGRDSRELYYITPDRRMMAVSVVADTGFAVQKSTPLFTMPFALPVWSVGQLANSIPYDVTTDGHRFVMSTPLNSDPATPNASPVTVIVNWTAALKK
jgi:eukaryotic-like serine/threonine-protein kinase